ncbi:cupredoxin family protein [soil metagenome]
MRSRNIVIAIPGIFLALTAMAGGNHAGGHDDQAIGKPGLASKVARTITVDMTDDMRFHSSNIAVKQGETIRFVAKNLGKVKHEMVLGTAKDLKEHAEVMKKNPEMEHADANMVTVAPGKSGEIIWQFTKAGKVDFGCLQPGHFDAGMKGMVNVAGSKMKSKGDNHVENKQ